MHYWDASPENWVQGAEQYAKGWIECFHAYQSLGPAETHQTIEDFQKVSEEQLMREVFDEGHVDVAIFQSTYLREWYKNGFNTSERNGELALKHPEKFRVNTRFDPRDGDAGMREFEANVERYQPLGAKLYTAEWNGDSRGYKLSDPECYRFLERAQELGVKNIHVHKGPTIWPLDKDAFDVSDVVHAGLSVVIGGLMHARPRFFAKVMGELLFWVGEDKMTFGSDYNIWTPKWQIEGFVDWEFPDEPEFADFPRLGVEGKKKILGLNAAKLYDLKVPDEFQLKEATPAAQDDSKLVAS